MPSRLSGNLIAVTDGTAPSVFVPSVAAIAQGLHARLAIILTAAVPNAGDYAPHANSDTFGLVADSIGANAARALSAVDMFATVAGAEARLVSLPSAMLMRHVIHAARYSDLAMFPPAVACGNVALRDRLMIAVLDGAACPILVVRGGDAAIPARRVMLAWNGSRACCRAWRDAARLIRRDAHVDIVIGNVAASSRIDGAELAGIAEQRVRDQGFEARMHRVAIHPAGEEWRSPVERLVELEQITATDLVVMGAGSSSDLDQPGFSKLTDAMIRNGTANLLIAR